ncbi:hypothetical protein, partial [Allopseudospirillum japonicum]|uniref:hypothetical protein n=1 Tax=Allopseudospirillum japonicum TaxID=64971 RepID=UPI001C4323C1
RADDSVGSPHVKVGYRQAPNRKTLKHLLGGFLRSQYARCFISKMGCKNYEQQNFRLWLSIAKAKAIFAFFYYSSFRSHE